MGDYISLADVRAEGLTVAMADNDRVNALIGDVEARVEDICRTKFAPTTTTLTMDGNGLDRLRLPEFCSELTSVALGETDLTLDDDVYLRDNGLQIARHDDAVFVEGRDNVVVVGKFGDTNASDECPAELKWAMRQWVIELTPFQADPDALQDRRMGTAKSHRAGGRSVGFAPADAPWSGNPEVDAILSRHRLPMAASI